MGVIMQLPRDAVLLRIFFGEDDKVGRLPLYEARRLLIVPDEGINDRYKLTQPGQ